MNFDLNIQNYKKPELEEIFELQKGYNSSAIELKETQLRDNINNDTTVSPDMKNKTVQFLLNAKNILMKGLEDIIISDYIKFNSDYTLKQSDIIAGSGNHNITEHTAAPYSYSFPGEYYKGVINPLKKRTKHQNLNIDTKFRDNYYKSSSTNFHLDLPIKFSNILSMNLEAFEFPTSYYVISSQLGNNFFYLRYEELFQLITIPDGNYNSNSITAYLNDFISNQISSASQFSNIKFVNNIDNILSNSGSGQMVIGIKDETTIFNFILDFQCDIYGNPDTSTPLPLKFGWQLGFRNGRYINNSSYVSEGVIDLNGPRYIFLVIDDYNNNVNNGFFSAFNSSVLNKNILARLSLYKTGLNNFFSKDIFNTLSSIRNYYGPVDIQKMHIQLLDEYGRIVNLNNMDYSFCLRFESAYDI